MGGSRGGGGGDRGLDPYLKNHKNIGFLSNTGPYPLKNHKATKPAFNVGPSSAGLYAGLWWYLGPPSPFQKNNNIVIVRPPLTKLSGSSHKGMSLEAMNDHKCRHN